LFQKKDESKSMCIQGILRKLIDFFEIYILYQNLTMTDKTSKSKLQGFDIISTAVHRNNELWSIWTSNGTNLKSTIYFSLMHNVVINYYLYVLII
jgi:hypothetical protein